jgi:hypothetical protein
MKDVVQIHALVPRELKRQAFVLFRQQDLPFSTWLRASLEAWIREVEAQRLASRHDESMVLTELQQQVDELQHTVHSLQHQSHHP